MPKKKVTTTKTLTKDGLFISRRMRRDAEITAKAEADANKLSQDDADDAGDLARRDADPKWQAMSDAEKTVAGEKAQAQATADARKKFGLK